MTQQQMLCQKDSFLCAVGDLDLSIAFTRRIGDIIGGSQRH
jgi:uncharacterized protein (AIM24 family)